MTHFAPRKLILFLGLSFLTGCLMGSRDVAGLVSTPMTPTAPPVSIDFSQCKTQLVDVGQKGSVSSVARGLYSDTKSNPLTGSSATAFTDQSATSIKLVYWNGHRYVREIVSGDGNGAFVRLAFQSNGLPMVFWTLGSSVKVAIRSAPLGTIGRWSAAVVDTGTAPRALEVSVSPLDQVSLVFLTDASTTGRPKFLYCDAQCTSPAGFQVMSPNPYIENSTIVASQTALGAAWCKASASTYYPAVAYSTSGAVRYAICQQSNLGNCANSANWVATNVVALGGLSAKLWIDPTLTGDVAVVAATGTSGITPYKMGVLACSSAPGVFNAGAVMGTSLSATQWMSLMKDGTGKLHLVANEGTASVKYYNSVTIDPVGTWNPGAVVETITLPAAHAGGATINLAKASLYLSYGTNVAPFDLKIARVTDYTQIPSAATYSRFVPDLSGNIQLGAAAQQQKNIAAASTSQGVPGLVYVDYSVGASTGAKLKFALRSGHGGDAAWGSLPVPGTINPMFPALVFDRYDMPWLSYFDSGTLRFYLTTNSNGDGSGNWSTFEFPATPAGAAGALPAANNTALVMDNSGGLSRPILIVIDTNATSKGVKAARFDPNTQLWSPVATIDSLSAGSAGAAHLSAVRDESGNFAVAYQDLNFTRARYAASSNGTTWMAPISVSGIGQGVGVSIAANPLNGKPAISYYDQGNNAVYYATCPAAISACTSGGSWIVQQVESAAGVSGISAASGQLLSTSLTFSPAGDPYLVYERGQGNDGNLIVATLKDGVWTQTVQAAGASGNLPGASALNFGVAGWNVATSLNAQFGPVSSFIGPGNSLYSTSCGD